VFNFLKEVHAECFLQRPCANDVSRRARSTARKQVRLFTSTTQLEREAKW